MLDCLGIQVIFAMGTASGGSERITESFCINNANPQLKDLKKILPIPRVLNLMPPLLHPLTKGKREKETLMQEMHRKDDDVMDDGAVMVKVLFCVFLRAGFWKNF
jgi:hypothetical protein